MKTFLLLIALVAFVAAQTEKEWKRLDEEPFNYQHDTAHTHNAMNFDFGSNGPHKGFTSGARTENLVSANQQFLVRPRLYQTKGRENSEIGHGIGKDDFSRALECIMPLYAKNLDDNMQEITKNNVWNLARHWNSPGHQYAYHAGAGAASPYKADKYYWIPYDTCVKPDLTSHHWVRLKGSDLIPVGHKSSVPEGYPKRSIAEQRCIDGKILRDGNQRVHVRGKTYYLKDMKALAPDHFSNPGHWRTDWAPPVSSSRKSAIGRINWCLEAVTLVEGAEKDKNGQTPYKTHFHAKKSDGGWEYINNGNFH